MNIIILKSFISRLDFISKRIEYQNNNLLEIKITNLKNNSDKYFITGLAIIKNETKEKETITFDIQLTKSQEILIIKSNYESDNKKIKDKNEEIDTFIITESNNKKYYTPKIKYLIHLVDGALKQAYIVNKKYKFENGISESHSKVNMNNKDITNEINSISTQHKSKR